MFYIYDNQGNEFDQSKRHTLLLLGERGVMATKLCQEIVRTTWSLATTFKLNKLKDNDMLIFVSYSCFEKQHER